MQIAIVDDIKTEQDYLAAGISQFCREHNLTCAFSFFTSGEAFLQNGKYDYDLTFLDIFMAGMNGMETGQAIRQHNKDCLIIFTTTSADFAVSSYRIRAFDYLVKPYTYSRLYETLDLCYAKISSFSSYISLKANRLNLKVMCRDIIYADYGNHYVQIHTDNEILRSKMYFDELTELLKPYPQFLYCNRNCVVNMDKIVGMDKLGFQMENGECLPVKATSNKNLRQIYADYIFEKLNGVE